MKKLIEFLVYFIKSLFKGGGRIPFSLDRLSKVIEFLLTMLLQLLEVIEHEKKGKKTRGSGMNLGTI